MIVRAIENKLNITNQLQGKDNKILSDAFNYGMEDFKTNVNTNIENIDNTVFAFLFFIKFMLIVTTKNTIAFIIGNKPRYN